MSESHDNMKGIWVGPCIMLGIAVLGGAVWFGYLAGRAESDRGWREECIKHDVAEYDQHSGRWKWKEIKEP